MSYSQFFPTFPVDTKSIVKTLGVSLYESREPQILENHLLNTCLEVNINHYSFERTRSEIICCYVYGFVRSWTPRHKEVPGDEIIFQFLDNVSFLFFWDGKNAVFVVSPHEHMSLYKNGCIVAC